MFVCTSRIIRLHFRSKIPRKRRVKKQGIGRQRRHEPQSTTRFQSVFRFFFHFWLSPCGAVPPSRAAACSFSTKSLFRFLSFFCFFPSIRVVSSGVVSCAPGSGSGSGQLRKRTRRRWRQRAGERASLPRSRRRPTSWTCGGSGCGCAVRVRGTVSAQTYCRRAKIYATPRGPPDRTVQVRSVVFEMQRWIDPLTNAAGCDGNTVTGLCPGSSSLLSPPFLPQPRWSSIVASHQPLQQWRPSQPVHPLNPGTTTDAQVRSSRPALTGCGIQPPGRCLIHILHPRDVPTAGPAVDDQHDEHLRDERWDAILWNNSGRVPFSIHCPLPRFSELCNYRTLGGHCQVVEGKF